MNDVQMAPDDYVLWLKGMFDMIGDRTPTPEEWARFRDQNIMQVGDVVMRRVEERELAQKEMLRREEQKQLEAAKLDAFLKYQEQAQRYATQAQQTISRNAKLSEMRSALATSTMSTLNFGGKVSK